MKEKYIVKLEPEDEYTHVPDESLNYNESMYFNLFDHEQRMGGCTFPNPSGQLEFGSNPS